MDPVAVVAIFRDADPRQRRPELHRPTCVLGDFHDGASANPLACALSIATFAASSKSTSQALNVTYNWSFRYGPLIAMCLDAMIDKLAMLVY